AINQSADQAVTRRRPPTQTKTGRHHRPKGSFRKPASGNRCGARSSRITQVAHPGTGQGRQTRTRQSDLRPPPGIPGREYRRRNRHLSPQQRNRPLRRHHRYL
ncbi:MAG: hypothetical protein, partial [Olavius algarvensis Gamma 3 endosymbiont]